jgi:hypothetical protein
MEVPALRHAVASPRCIRDVVPVDQDDLVEVIGQHSSCE